MSSRRRNAILTSSILGMFVLLLMFANGPQAVAAPARDPIASHMQDAESLIALKIKAQGLIRRGPSTQFRNREVEIGPQVHKKLGTIARSAFKRQDLFRRKLSTIPPASGILLGAPITQARTFEFDDSFLLVKSTSIIVMKPRALAGISRHYRSFLGTKGRGKPTSSRLSSLDAESLKGLENFIRTELPRRPNNDPLKIAFRNGKDALLEAIAEGKGLFETIEEVVVSKKPAAFLKGIPQLPVFENGVLNYKKRRPIDSALLRAIGSTRRLRGDLGDRFPGLRGAPPRALPPTRPGRKMSKVHRGMLKKFDAQFMTGFTLSSVLDWSKTWRFESGLFRVTLGAGYAVGLRFPVRVHGDVTPSRVTVSGPNDIPTSFKTSITAEPFDADCAYYRSVGVGANEPDETCGKELALSFGVGYGYKFRALYKTILDVPFRMRLGIDFSKDLTPPFARNNSRGVAIWVPPDLTGTRLRVVGLIDGFLKVGLLLGGTGTAHLDYESFHGSTKDHQALTFRNTTPLTNTTTLPALTRGNGQDRVSETYGFRIYNPVYRIHPTLTPGAQVSVTVGYRWFSRTISTGAMWFSAMELLMPPASFGRHDGTPNEFSWREGRKVFQTRSGR